MVRVQVQLEAAQHRQLKRRAKQLGISVAELERRCVDAQFRSQEPETRDDRIRRVRTVLGKYADPAGPGNVAQNHDATLADVYRR